MNLTLRLKVLILFFMWLFPPSILADSTNTYLRQTDRPDIEGNDWSGYFTRTDTSFREYLTASVVYLENSQISITTSLTGLGHYLRGTINSKGDMLLYDIYDGEDWTTHSGPATATEINIYDYIWPPHAGDPTPPLNVIKLYRSPPSPPPAPLGVEASDGLFFDKITVNWSPSRGATYYKVYACNTNAIDSCIALTQVNTNYYDDTRRVSGKIFYRIKACNDNKCSQFSAYDTGYNQVISIAPILHLLLK